MRADDLELVLAKAEAVEVEGDGGAVQHAHHDAFAAHGGQDRDAQVDLAAADGELDAAVLREAPLGDVEVGHDLDARGDGEREVLWRGDHLVEHAVDAVADLELVLERLEVDVGGLVLDGLQQHEVQQPPHGRRVGHLLDALEVDGAGVDGVDVDSRAAARAVELLEDALDRLALAGVVLVVELPDILRVGDGTAHGAVEEELQVLQRVHVERVAEGQQQLAVLVGQGDDLVVFRDRRRHLRDDLGRYLRKVRQVDRPQAQPVGYRREDVLLAGEIERHYRVLDGDVAVVGEVHRLAQLVIGDQPHLHQEVFEGPFSLLRRILGHHCLLMGEAARHWSPRIPAFSSSATMLCSRILASRSAGFFALKIASSIDTSPLW